MTFRAPALHQTWQKWGKFLCRRCSCSRWYTVGFLRIHPVLQSSCWHIRLLCLTLLWISVWFVKYSCWDLFLHVVLVLLVFTFLLSLIFICSFSPLYDVDSPLYPCITCLVWCFFLMLKPHNPGCSGIAIFPDVCACVQMSIFCACMFLSVCSFLWIFILSENLIGCINGGVFPSFPSCLMKGRCSKSYMQRSWQIIFIVCGFYVLFSSVSVQHPDFLSFGFACFLVFFFPVITATAAMNFKWWLRL